MMEFDDDLPWREYDNFQFVDFHSILSRGGGKEKMESRFALEALMEIPHQCASWAWDSGFRF